MGARHAVPLPVAFRTTDPIAAFDHFRPLVEAIGIERVQPCRMDPAVLRINVERGVASLDEHAEVITSRAPHTDFTLLRELPALGLALLYAADRVGSPISSGAIAALLTELRPLREMTLLQLEVFALCGILPADRVAAIRSGTGPLDTARDAVAICGAFREFPVEGKHPFSAAQLANLNRLGSALIPVLVPKNATPDPAEPTPEALLRDRFYSEIVRRHDMLRDAGVAAVGLRQVDQHVPPLGSKVGVTAGEVERNAPGPADKTTSTLPADKGEQGTPR